ncbi:Plastocyanin-like [Macleaya cordata]|uniref:Plastocyanin-like n=1 Tax=Macleaya cordata TaxID=56857 RepID=A0A200R195_MACCD|nr:Plastocyanin-like [Macleaya cordata]
MASNQFFFITLMMVAIVILPSVALATEYIVGDDSGWTIKFDYQAWAKDKTFMVGDKLVFNYPAGAHNVFKVNGTGFKDCIKPPINEAVTSGNDVITLATPGRKWYICGVAQHCATGGQKLFITVQDPNEMSAPAPAPVLPTPGASTPNSANGILTSGYQVVMMAMVAIGAMVAMV